MQNKKGRGLMWIMTSNSYLSIVSKDCGPAELLVRARRAGDIEKVFPNAKVIRQTDSDYLYRAILPRDVVKQALAAMIDLIDYPNFKDSVGRQVIACCLCRCLVCKGRTTTSA